MDKKQNFFAWVSLALLILLASCEVSPAAPTSTPTTSPVATLAATSTPTSLLPEGKIIFEIYSDKKFAGSVYGQGKTAIVMANMGSGGDVQWDPFVEAVDKLKFTVVTFNYLQADFSGATQEIGIVLAELRKSGYKRVVCIGASLGATACRSMAHEPEMIGLVMIAGQNQGGSLKDVKYPKLFIAGENDSLANSLQLAYSQAAEPKELVLYPGEGLHGTDLFYSSTHRDQFLQALLDFVDTLP
jgi:dienelactone hydrolase